MRNDHLDHENRPTVGLTASEIAHVRERTGQAALLQQAIDDLALIRTCLLYTSDAADE